MKGIVENLLRHLSIENEQITYSTSSSKSALFHPGRSAVITIESKNKKITLGIVGEIHPALAHKHGFKQSVCLFEVNLDAVRLHRRKYDFAGIPTTPSMMRDLTVDVKS